LQAISPAKAATINKNKKTLECALTLIVFSFYDLEYLSKMIEKQDKPLDKVLGPGF
jgi:hypothetical protein